MPGLFPYNGLYAGLSPMYIIMRVAEYRMNGWRNLTL